MQTPRILAFALGAPVIGWLAFVSAQTAEDVQRAGFSATFSAGRATVTVPMPAAAFVLAEDESPHPEIRARSFTAAFAARVALPASGRWRFGFELEGGSGQLSVTEIDRTGIGQCEAEGGLALTPWIELEAGEVELVISFQRDEARAARLRTLWQLEYGMDRGFPLEAIPSRFVHTWETLESVSSAGLDARRGRAELEQLGCSNCHLPSATSERAVGRRARSKLDRLARGASIDWLTRWIASPRSVRPGTDMPALFFEGGEEDTLAIAHFLASLGSDEQLERTPDAARGAVIYRERGCIACHDAFLPPASIEEDEWRFAIAPFLVPAHALGDLRGRWTIPALADFLHDPIATFPDGRMPAMGLTRRESRQLAAYLIEQWPEDAERAPIDPRLAERGHELIETRGCLACHELEGTQDRSAPKRALDALSAGGGCLEGIDPRLPSYALDEARRARLLAGITQAARATGESAPLDAAGRRIDLLGCRHCHALDGEGGVPERLRPYFVSDEETDLGDEGRFPPDLSGVGAKLNTAFLTRVIADGEVSRPYMHTRMPHFGDEAARELAPALAALVGVRAHDDLEPPTVTDAQVLMGRELMGMRAMACVSCHVHGDHQPLGTPGLAMTQFGERLRYEWFRSFVLDPAHYLPGTRMPAFGAGGRSLFVDWHDGDMEAQADAMWAYFGLGEFMPLPAGLADSRSTRLTVGERPRVLRSFLDQAGSRAIAVGFPIGIHFSFDAQGARLVECWKGDFLDAGGAWSGRGGEVSGGRGPTVWRSPPGPPIWIGTPPDPWPESPTEELALEFGGYRLDAEGVPTFLYSMGGVEITERLTPALAPDRLVREFAMLGLARPTRVWVRVPAGGKVTAGGSVRTIEEHPRADGETWVELLFPAFSAHNLFTLETPL